MLIVFHREMKVVNKEHQSILDLKLPFRNYDARIAFVCFEVPCCFEVHVPVAFFYDNVFLSFLSFQSTISLCTALCCPRSALTISIVAVLNYSTWFGLTLNMLLNFSLYLSSCFFLIPLSLLSKKKIRSQIFSVHISFSSQFL